MGSLKTILKRKIKASSLTEVIVATSILLIIFAISLITLNNIMVGSLQQDTSRLDTKALELIYKYQNQQLKIPQSYAENDLEIEISRIKKEGINWISIEILNKNTKKSIVKRILKNEVN